MSQRVIGQHGQAVLIEWTDGAGDLHRSILPAGTALPLPEEELAAGIPFGAVWRLSEEAMHQFAQQLHAEGIWTYADAAERIREFRAIVTKVIAASILDAARGG